MRHVGPLLAVLTLGCAAPVPDDHGWHINETPATDEPWRKHDGPFLATLFITDDAEALYDRWNSEPGTFRLNNIHVATPGAKIEAVVVFVGCQPDAAGNCNIQGRATVETSDGRVLARNVEVPLFIGHPPSPNPALNISEHGVGLVVEEKIASYRFRMVVTDLTARRQVTLEHDLEVTHNP